MLYFTTDVTECDDLLFWSAVPDGNGLWRTENGSHLDVGCQSL